MMYMQCRFNGAFIFDIRINQYTAPRTGKVGSAALQKGIRKHNAFLRLEKQHRNTLGAESKSHLFSTLLHVFRPLVRPSSSTRLVPVCATCEPAETPLLWGRILAHMASSFVFPDEMQARVTSASSSSSSTIACLRSRILLEGRKTDDDGKIKKSEQIEYQFSLPEMHKVRRKGLVLGSDEIRGEFQMDLAAFEISVDENKLDTYKLAVKDSKYVSDAYSRF